MMIENLSGMSSYQGQDYKTEKKTELEEVRAIEESGEGATAELDMAKQGVSRDQFVRPPGDEHRALTYNEKGLFREEPEPEAPAESESIDLVV